MCRLLAYRGVPILLDQLLFQPRNSIVKQSYAAREIEEPLNGDGFGLGFYAPDLDDVPAVFVSTSPAWSNRNLRSLAPRLKAPTLFAHVRAASVGDISEANCHPFQYGRFLGMHNGGIGGFAKIRRRLRTGLSDEMYSWVRGQTDSEHFMAVVMDKLRKVGEAYKLDDMVRAMRESIRDVEAMKAAEGVTEETYLNFVLSDGLTMVGTRYISKTEEEALSMYYSQGSRYICEDGICRMEPAEPHERSVLIVSEKLTDLRDDWKPVPQNHMVIVSADYQARVEAI